MADTFLNCLASNKEARQGHAFQSLFDGRGVGDAEDEKVGKGQHSVRNLDVNNGFAHI